MDAGCTWTLAYSPDGRMKQETTGAGGRNAEWVYNGTGQRQTLKTRFSTTVTAPDSTYAMDNLGYLQNVTTTQFMVSLGWSTNALKTNYRSRYENNTHKLNSTFGINRGFKLQEERDLLAKLAKRG